MLACSTRRTLGGANSAATSRSNSRRKRQLGMLRAGAQPAEQRLIQRLGHPGLTNFGHHLLDVGGHPVAARSYQSHSSTVQPDPVR